MVALFAFTSCATFLTVLMAAQPLSPMALTRRPTAASPAARRWPPPSWVRSMFAIIGSSCCPTTDQRLGSRSPRRIRPLLSTQVARCGAARLRGMSRLLTIRVGVAFGVVALVVAGCTSSTSKHVISPGPSSAPPDSPVSASPSAPPVSSASASRSAPASDVNGLSTPGPTGALRVFADVTIKGSFDAAETGLVAAQGPDGAVFVAGHPASPQIVWVVDGVQPAAVAEHVTGPVTALAADTANLYVGIASSVYAYSRTTGALVHRWSPTALSGSVTQVTQLAIAGDRLWGLFTESDDGPTGAPGVLVEIDPTSTSVVRTISGITGAFSFAAGIAGVYYVTKQSSALVEQTNNGATASAPTHQ